ncbi:hypothetical protein [Sphingomonas ginsenosidivorax]|uniref:hypothetical protein n=1 Tax=Sphingomonas ginsenosidivorax TaxID=862135 RepID=UPI0013159981|nr:hypothetical protein [Sphingomonas ginsenosidivorax]
MVMGSDTGATPDLIEAMKALLAILDGEGHLLAAAYVSMAVDLLESPAITT